MNIIIFRGVYILGISLFSGGIYTRNIIIFRNILLGGIYTRNIIIFKFRLFKIS